MPEIDALRMKDYMKPAEGKRFKIEYFSINEETVKMLKLRDLINRRREFCGVEAGTYVRLCDKENPENMGVIMSDMWMEKETNRDFLEHANDDVLIAGLGLGMIVMAIQDRYNISSITVIEKEQEIIDLVAKQLPLNKKVKIINADIFHHRLDKDKKFDTIYFDIWTGISGDNYFEMKKLHKKFMHATNKFNPKRWMGSWRKEDCKRLDKEEQVNLP